MLNYRGALQGGRCLPGRRQGATCSGEPRPSPAPPRAGAQLLGLAPVVPRGEFALRVAAVVPAGRRGWGRQGGTGSGGGCA